MFSCGNLDFKVTIVSSVYRHKRTMWCIRSSVITLNAIFNQISVSTNRFLRTPKLKFKRVIHRSHFNSGEFILIVNCNIYHTYIPSNNSSCRQSIVNCETSNSSAPLRLSLNSMMKSSSFLPNSLIFIKI